MRIKDDSQWLISGYSIDVILINANTASFGCRLIIIGLLIIKIF